MNISAYKTISQISHPVALLPAGLTCAASYLLLFLTTNPSLPGPTNGYDTKRWGALLLLAGLAAGGSAMPRFRTWLLPAGIALVGLTAAMTSAHPASALAVLATLAGLLMLGWSCARAAAYGDTALLRGWCCVAVVAAILSAGRTAIAIFAGVQISHLDSDLLFLGFADRRFFVQLTTPLLPCMIALVFDTVLVRRLRLAAGGAALLWAMLIWLNGGSGPVYALTLGLMAAALLLGWRSVLPWALALAGVMAAGWLLLRFSALWLPFEQVLQSATVPGLSGRPALWAKAFSAIADKPFFGWGPGNYAFFVDVRNGHPHNMILSWAVGFGLIGLALVAWLFWRTFDPVRMRSRVAALPTNARPYAMAITLSALAALAHANVSGLTIMPMAQILLAVTLGLWAGVAGRVAPAVHHGVRTHWLRLLLAGLIVITAAVSMTRNCTYEPVARGACAYTPAFWFAYPTG